MIRRAGPRQTWRGGGSVLRGLLLGAILACAAPVAAQQHEQIVSIRQREYNVALNNHQANLELWNLQEQNRLTILDSVGLANRSGNSARIERAQQRAMSASLEITRLTGLADQTARVLDERRKALVDALGDWVDALEVQLNNSSPAQQGSIARQIQGLLNQIQDLQPPPARPSYLPALNLEPTDGRDEIQFKIVLIERREQEAQQEITRLNEVISRLQRQQSRQQIAGDISSARDRFDAGPPGARAGRPADPASAGAGAGPQTIRQQIEQLIGYRDELMIYQQELRSRSAAFRSRLGIMGGDLQ
jgi:hypothetical protein